MKCIMCGQTAVPTHTKYIRDLGEFVLIIKNVPCFKCTCGEIYYDAETVESLEKIEAAVKQFAAEDVLIVKYDNVAA